MRSSLNKVPICVEGAMRLSIDRKTNLTPIAVGRALMTKLRAQLSESLILMEKELRLNAPIAELI